MRPILLIMWTTFQNFILRNNNNYNNNNNNNNNNLNRGCWIQGAKDLKIDYAKVISSLEEGGSYKFLEVLENEKQEDKILFFKTQRRRTCKVIYYLV